MTNTLAYIATRYEKMTIAWIKMKVYCSCCARQICRTIFDTKIQAPLPARYLGCGKYACADCSRDLDENGLFPEERGYYEVCK